VVGADDPIECKLVEKNAVKTHVALDNLCLLIDQ